MMMSSRVGAISKIGDLIKTELKEDEDITYDRLYEIMEKFQSDLAKMETEGKCLYQCIMNYAMNI